VVTVEAGAASPEGALCFCPTALNLSTRSVVQKPEQVHPLESWKGRDCNRAAAGRKLIGRPDRESFFRPSLVDPFMVDR